VEKGEFNNKQRNTWGHMLQRCYDETCRDKFPTYVNCTVCDKWLNFQNFLDWYKENFYAVEKEKMCLDKDILHKGNKIYSPETCVFVPQNINKLFTKSNGTRGEYPIGVTYSKTNKKFRANCNNGKKQIFLEYFATPTQAFQCYKDYKEKVIKRIASQYIDKIPNNLYEALMKYEVEITD